MVLFPGQGKSARSIVPFLSPRDQKSLPPPTNEEEACRIRSYIITIMLKLREGERDSDKSYDIIFYHLNELIDQILLDKGLKTVDKVVPF